MPVRFYDESGSERDLSWAEDLYGIQVVHDPGVFPVFELIALHAASGQDKVLTITVQGEAGQPLPGLLVGVGPRDVVGEVQKETTDIAGQARLSLDDAHLYDLPVQGHYACAVIEEASHVYNSAGWVNPGKDRPASWLNPVFRHSTAQPGPTPTPGPKALTDEMWDELMEKLDRIIDLLQGDLP